MGEQGGARPGAARRALVTFPATTAALAAEAALGAAGLPERLVPVPGTVRAGCGLAWSTPPELLPQVLSALERARIPWEDTAEVWL